MRFIRDGEKGGGGDMEVGGEGKAKGGKLYTYRYTVTIRMTSALRWAAMRTVLMLHNCEGQCRKTASTDHNFLKRKESRQSHVTGHQTCSRHDLHGSSLAPLHSSSSSSSR